LDTQGIFRISGSVSAIDDLSVKIDSGASADLKTLDIHVLAGAFKLYFRQLPEPLLTFGLYDEFLKTSSMPSEEIANHLKATYAKLPAENLAILKDLLQFLRVVADKSAVNMMTDENLGIVFGPNVLRSKDSEGGDFMSAMLAAPKILAAMIDSVGKTLD